MKHSWLFLIALGILTSCAKTFYQVYNVETENLEQQQNALVFSNKDCCIYYNLWGETGNLGFIFENTSEEEIFLDLTRSFFINNGIAYDYYEEGSQTSTISSSVQIGVGLNANGLYFTNAVNPYWWNPGVITKGYSVNANSKVSSAHSITKNNVKFICIPPKSIKYIQGFNISTFVMEKEKDNTFNFPKKESNIIKYNFENTPLKFRNRLVYGFSLKDMDNFIDIDNEFWIKSVQNFSPKGFYKTEKRGKTLNYSENRNASQRKEELQKSPQRFYNRYYLYPNDPIDY